MLGISIEIRHCAQLFCSRTVVRVKNDKDMETSFEAAWPSSQIPAAQPARAATAAPSRSQGYGRKVLPFFHHPFHPIQNMINKLGRTSRTL